MSEKKTITAIATPPGDGGVSIIRISGPAAVEIANEVVLLDLFSSESHKVYFTKVLDDQMDFLDEVLLFKMLAPRSFTGENVVEIHCHGGQLITKKILKRILEAGAHPALPGEFTQRAFLNGKIDLSKAESIQLMIHAKNEAALKAAKHQLEGRLSLKIIQFQEELFYLAAILEAWIDYPEEGLEFMSMDEYLQRLDLVISELTNLKRTFDTGQKLNTSTKLCLLGAPNVGKSSLLNALMQKERAIVTPIAGTTRDVIEGEIILEGHHFTLLDTAGIRHTEEVVEQEGIRRSFEAKEQSDLIFLLLDGSRPLTEFEEGLLDSVDQEKTIVITNKKDLLHPSNPSHGTLISAKNLDGIEELKKILIHWIEKQHHTLSKDEVILVQQRHFEAIEKGLDYLLAAKKALQEELGGELAVMDLKSGIHALSEIIGRNVTEEVLSQIFNHFCVGK